MSVKSSYTLWSPADTVKDAAEALGIANLPDEVAKTLAMDIEYRIHEVVEQALKFMIHSKRTTVTAKDISAALRVLNIEPLYGYETGRPVSYKEVPVAAGQTLYYLDNDEEVDFDRLINEPIPKVPREPSFTAHWLAIEGVQPSVPQNPHSGEIKALPPQVRGSQTVHSTTALTHEVDVRPLVKHMISKELQLYFDRVVRALEDEDTKGTALYSLRYDPGLHQLTPYFVQFVQEKISINLKSSLPLLRTMLDVVDALLTNPAIFVEPYVHQIVPSVLTILVAKHVGPEDNEESFEVRAYAASLLRSISQKFSQVYYTLRPRLTRTLLKGFLDVSRPMSSHYGIVVALSALGAEVVRVVILGNIRPWYESVFNNEQASQSDLATKRLQEALVGAFKLLETSPVADKDKMIEQLGEPVTELLLENNLGNILD
ncbi:Transcription initiation factor TFIID subunit 6 [Wickerhamiella sorbophila]|uniref:TBP-associated factor 6 n=1 Tax=Wickerhamiella sorbophila TaxID=45607 RepID=A0A2T0FD95_9ASCO|nr:Transcription initiation factor TFIID subunit 6 [Wickerhamiella sorbophila]PRT52972.1 Transcription initiation factor TFIID subunit 6 [Wickerhamiella sorbophila]